jgi:hypothetical protein
MDTAAAQQKLMTMNEWQPGLSLEPYELLDNLAPPGALDHITTFMLTDQQHTYARDRQSRSWRPLLVIKDELWLDPSPALLDQLLAAAGYFEQPDAFGDDLLLQFHRFALDFYQGYQVREEQFSYADGELTIQGIATRGAGHALEQFTFTTRVSPHHPATFTPHPAANLWD